MVNAATAAGTPGEVGTPSVSVPEPVELGPTSFASLSEACQAGVDAEIADAALYDELSPLVSHADILRVFSNLQQASLNSHLPAFEACN